MIEFFAKVVNAALVTLVYPPSDGDQHKQEGMRDSRHPFAIIVESSPIQADRVSGPYALSKAFPIFIHLAPNRSLLLNGVFESLGSGPR